MGKAIGGLLGGGKQKSTQSASSEPWAAVQPYLKDLFAKGRSAQQKMAGVSLPQQLTAGFTDEQLSAQNQQLELADQIGGQTGNTLEALNRGLNATDVKNDPFLQSAIQAAINPVVQNFERSVIPAQELNALATSGYGSSRHGIAEGIARSDLNRQLLDVTAKMGSTAYAQGQDTMLKSMALAPEVYKSMLLPSTIIEGVGAQKQAMEQQLLDDALTKWNFERSKDMDSLQQYAQLLQGNFGSTSTSTATTKGGGGGLGQLIGTGLSIAGMF